MASWGSQSNNAANSVSYAPQQFNITANTANQTKLFQNTVVDAIAPRKEVGQFGVTVTAMNAANASSDNKKVAHTGWQLRTAGTGGVKTFAISNNGSNFANGETIKVSNGSVNAVITVSTNATGAFVSSSITNPGAGWANVGDAVITFNREKHVSNVTVTGTGTGYDNTDLITVSNGTINATATVSTNSTGGLTNTSFTITNVGLFLPAQANTNAVVAITNSTGGASGGSGATLSVNLTTSTNGNGAITLGGRAGRVHYETLVAMSSMVGAGSAQFPNT